MNRSEASMIDGPNGGEDQETDLEAVTEDELNFCDPLEGSNVFVLGNTGVGKSTFLQWIIGNEFQFVEATNQHTFDHMVLAARDESKLDTRFKIGHKMESCTSDVQRVELIANGDTDYEEAVFFVDTPGFLDTQGKTTDILNFLKTRHAFNVSGETRFVLLTSYVGLTADRGGAMINMLNQAAALLGIDTQNENTFSMLQSCLFLFTHLPTEISLQRLRRIISHQMEEKRRILPGTSFHYQILNDIIEGKISFGLFCPVRSLRPTIFAVLDGMPSAPSNFKYHLSENLENFINRKADAIYHALNGYKNGGYFKQGRERWKVLEHLSKLIDDPNVQRLLETSDRELSQREEEQCEALKRQINECIQGDMTAMSLAPVLLSTTGFTEAYSTVLRQHLQTELLSLRNDVTLEEFSRIIKKFHELQKLSLQDNFDPEINKVIIDCTRALSQTIIEFTRVIRLTGTIVFKRFETVCPHKYDVLGQFLLGIEMIYCYFCVREFVSGREWFRSLFEDEVELWKALEAIFDFCSLHNIIRENPEFHLSFKDEAARWQALNLSSSHFVDALNVQSQELLLDENSLLSAATLVIISNQLLRREAYTETYQQLFDDEKFEKNVEDKLLAILTDLEQYEPEPDNSGFLQRIERVKNCAEKLKMLIILEKVSSIMETFTGRLEQSHRDIENLELAKAALEEKIVEERRAARKREQEIQEQERIRSEQEMQQLEVTHNERIENFRHEKRQAIESDRRYWREEIESTRRREEARVSRIHVEIQAERQQNLIDHQEKTKQTIEAMQLTHQEKIRHLEEEQARWLQEMEEEAEESARERESELRKQLEVQKARHLAESKRREERRKREKDYQISQQVRDLEYLRKQRRKRRKENAREIRELEESKGNWFW